MVLMNFSEPDHVKKLLDGDKQQTTRPQRKNPLGIGDTLHCWYMSRVRKGCINCIQTEPTVCKYGVMGDSDYIPGIKCNQHTNFFGTATVTTIEEFCPFDIIADMSKNISERYTILDEWAVKDGFEDWISATTWFTKKYGTEWLAENWTVIHFEPDWVKGGEE